MQPYPESRISPETNISTQRQCVMTKRPRKRFRKKRFNGQMGRGEILKKGGGVLKTNICSNITIEKWRQRKEGGSFF
uniref:Uncharacterized protein n=1 Tax=Octopus bimaculoides TaxID=37653 RepID=A0A0L8HEK8_OCTBM